MKTEIVQEHVEEALAHLSEGGVEPLAMRDPDTLNPMQRNFAAAWRELEKALDELQKDEAMPSEARVPGGHVEHRPGTLEDRLVAVEEDVQKLLTQDHAVSRWGKRIEADLERVTERVNDLSEGFPGRVRGTSRLDPEAPDATLTELLQRLRDRVDAAHHDLGQDDGVIQHLEDEVERLATGQQALHEKIGGPDGPWHTSIAERLAQANRNIRRVLKRVDALAGWLDLSLEPTGEGDYEVVSTVDGEAAGDGAP